MDPRILQDAVILYIWVTPEQSVMKNFERAKVGEDGSTLHHCVPYPVMALDYGCDDINRLLQESGREGCIQLQVGKEVYLLPTVKFDNRRDLTSFARDRQLNWSSFSIWDLRDALSETCQKLWEIYTSVQAQAPSI